MPLATIIIPVYNTDKYLKQCLDSVVNQTYKNIEIIVINDASTDYSYTILKHYVKEHKNIKLINNYINLGVSTSRNLGLNAANGDYVYFLDSDDYIELETIKKMVNLSLIYEVPLIEGTLSNRKFHLLAKPTPVKEETVYDDITKKNSIKNHSGYVCNKLYNHRKIEDLRFPEQLIYEDIAFSYPCLFNCERSVLTNKAFYFYRKNPQSITHKNRFVPNEKIFDLYTILDILKKRCEKSGVYELYQDQIETILKNKAYIPLLQTATWRQIKKDDKIQILNNLYQFSRKEYHIAPIKDIDWEGLELKENIWLQMKQRLLQQYINENVQDVMFENSIKHTRRILSKYVK